MAIIGIDIGNVIIGGDHEDRTFFGDDYLLAPAVWGAFDSIRDLVNQGHEIVLISKCGIPVMTKTVSWLQYHDFFEHTGVSIDSMYFVRNREEKAPLAQDLGVDIMIDDREDIIQSMEGVVELPILFTSWDATMEAIKEYDSIDV